MGTVGMSRTGNTLPGPARRMCNALSTGLLLAVALLSLGSGPDTARSDALDTRHEWNIGDSVFVKTPDLAPYRGSHVRTLRISRSTPLHASLVLFETELGPSRMGPRHPRAWMPDSFSIGAFDEGPHSESLTLEVKEDDQTVVSIPMVASYNVVRRHTPPAFVENKNLTTTFAERYRVRLVQYAGVEPVDNNKDPAVTCYLERSSDIVHGDAPAFCCALIVDGDIISTSLWYGCGDNPWTQLPSSVEPDIIWRGDLAALIEQGKKVSVALWPSKEAALRSVGHDRFAEISTRTPLAQLQFYKDDQMIPCVWKAACTNEPTK